MTVDEILDGKGDLLVVADKSTAPIVCAFTDENGAAVVPVADSIIWSLTDSMGNAINSRTDITGIVSATSVTIILSGLDTIYLGSGRSGDQEKRILTVECLYNSDLGNNLPLKNDGYFMVQNLIAVE